MFLESSSRLQRSGKKTSLIPLGRWPRLLHSAPLALSCDWMLRDTHQFVTNLGLCGWALGEQLLCFFYECVDDVFAGDFAHWHAVFKDHADAASKRDAEL